jgi:MFS family permease
MSDLGVQPSADVAPGLSEWQRVTNTFTAPSKTFEDIKRGHRSWWMPFLILAIVGYIFFAVVNTRIGMRTTAENQVRLDPKAEERLSQLTPEQRETQMKFSVYFTEGIFVGGPVVLLIIVAVGSLVLWGTVNFLFGGKATFGGVFAAWMFASLPSIVKTLIGVIVIYAGTAPESFNIRNFAPTNLGAFLNPAETNKVLYSLATSLDIITLWCCVLMAIGVAIVAGIKRSSGYIAVFGWWAIMILGGVIFAAATS